jgi:hypothetical protein
MMMSALKASTAANVAASTTSPAAESCTKLPNMKNDQQQSIDSNSATAAKAATMNHMIISTAEAMNPSRRNTMEDRHIILAPGSWGAPDLDMAFLAVCDGHGGRLEK